MLINSIIESITGKVPIFERRFNMLKKSLKTMRGSLLGIVIALIILMFVAPEGVLWGLFASLAGLTVSFFYSLYANSKDEKQC